LSAPIGTSCFTGLGSAEVRDNGGAAMNVKFAYNKEASFFQVYPRRSC